MALGMTRIRQFEIQNQNFFSGRGHSLSLHETCGRWTF